MAVGSYQGLFRLTKVVDDDGKEIIIPSQAKPILRMVDKEGKEISKTTTKILNPFKIRLTSVEDSPNTYRFSTKIVNSIGGTAVVSPSTDENHADVMKVEEMIMTQLASFDPYASRLETAVLATLGQSMRVSIDTVGILLILQTSDGRAIHGIRIIREEE